MKKLIFTFIIIFPFISNCQQYVDSLKKYSYHIIGFGILNNTDNKSLPNENITDGTVFFIRKNEHLFLVTAKHVLSGCDSLTKDKNHPSTMVVWISNDETSKLMSLNVSVIKDTSSCLPFALSPDIIVVEIFDSIAKNVFSVESLIHPLYKKLNNAIVIGYPGITSITANARLIYKPPSFIDFKKGQYYPYEQYTDKAETKVDSINFFTTCKNTWNYKIIQGFSGSPFYVQEKKSKEWRIAGICAAGNLNIEKDEIGILSVRIEFALDYINSYLNLTSSK